MFTLFFLFTNLFIQRKCLLKHLLCVSGAALGTDKAQPLPADDVILWEEGVERRQKNRETKTQRE